MSSRKRFTTEQIIRKLREAEVALAKGQPMADVPPAEYRAGGYYVPDLQRLENSLS